jgi:hypothetical protein
MSNGVMAVLDVVLAVTLLVIDKRDFQTIAKIVAA